jgi:hypothetical protein
MKLSAVILALVFCVVCCAPALAGPVLPDPACPPCTDEPTVEFLGLEALEIAPGSWVSTFSYRLTAGCSPVPSFITLNVCTLVQSVLGWRDWEVVTAAGERIPGIKLDSLRLSEGESLEFRLLYPGHYVDAYAAPWQIKAGQTFVSGMTLGAVCGPNLVPLLSFRALPLPPWTPLVSWFSRLR